MTSAQFHIIVQQATEAVRLARSTGRRFIPSVYLEGLAFNIYRCPACKTPDLGFQLEGLNIFGHPCPCQPDTVEANCVICDAMVLADENGVAYCDSCQSQVEVLWTI